MTLHPDAVRGMTFARRRALETLARRGRDGFAFLSNHTETYDGVTSVHWRAAAWLVNNGYARRGFIGGEVEIVRLTDAGAGLARDFGWVVL